MPAGCSSTGGLAVNRYISPEDHLQTVVDKGTAQAAGRYRIVCNKLPRGADGRREQMARRLAAHDDDTKPLDPAKPADAGTNPTMADQYPMEGR